jgi:hypothetical protein
MQKLAIGNITVLTMGYTSPAAAVVIKHTKIGKCAMKKF